MKVYRVSIICTVTSPPVTGKWVSRINEEALSRLFDEMKQRGVPGDPYEGEGGKKYFRVSQNLLLEAVPLDET